LKHNIVSKVLGNNNLKTVDFEKMNSDSRRSLDEIDVSIEEYVKVEGLPVGHMQFVEIAREVDKSNIKIVVFDEPTAVLAESEAQSLLRTIRKLADKGIAILFISHRLDEVIDICDNASILRDGELVAVKSIKDTNVMELAELMVGRKIEIIRKKKKIEENAEPVLKIKDLYVDMPGERVKGIDLEIKKGEILGIAGLAGQGKIGIANGIMGFYPSTGEITYQGSPLALNDTPNVLSKGVAFVSEDRKGVGLILDASIELNIAFTALEVQNKFLKKFVFFNLQDGKLIRKHAQKMIKDLDIRCRSAHQNVGSLSGGNQQKVCIARALTQEPSLMFVSEPTRGIDIGAKKLVLDLLVKLNRELNMTIVMTSSELAEVRSVSDRIIIISDGKIAGELQPEDADVKFGLLMSGESLEEEGIVNA
jgi:simple sugar transport system ATP-binding protein